MLDSAKNVSGLKFNSWINNFKMQYKSKSKIMCMKRSVQSV
jgi:hypothetical protein